MNNPFVFKRWVCRVCTRKNLTKILSLGPTPLANAFLNKEQVESFEEYYPLDLYFCNNCSFLQLGHVVSPKIIFSDYVYLSSTSPVFIKHFEDFEDKIEKEFKLNKNSLVVDIGSNDGILLKPFKEKNIRVLGIEPAKKIAEIAIKKGINTIPEFLSVKIAKKIANKYGKANIITATNVFAHIDDLDEVITSIKHLMSDKGIFIIEVPYLIDFVEKKYFDLVYHEHLSYWSVSTFKKLFSRLDMEVFKVEKVPVHGGSIRVYVKRKTYNLKIDDSVERFINKEKKSKLDRIDTYHKLRLEIEKNRIKLLDLLLKLKKEGKSIAGYGAPAKGNTLLNYFNIGSDVLNYIIDDSIWKQGLYTPGKRIPVKASSYLKNNKVDFLLILAWNFSKSIIEKNTEFKKSGGKFIIPVPSPKIV